MSRPMFEKFIRFTKTPLGNMFKYVQITSAKYKHRVRRFPNESLIDFRLDGWIIEETDEEGIASFNFRHIVYGERWMNVKGKKIVMRRDDEVIVAVKDKERFVPIAEGSTKKMPTVKVITDKEWQKMKSAYKKVKSDTQKEVEMIEDEFEVDDETLKEMKQLMSESNQDSESEE